MHKITANFISLPRKFTFLLIVSPWLLTACQFSNDGIDHDATALGPQGCQHLEQIKKFNQTRLEAQSVCFDRTINDLHEHGLLVAKGAWLKRTQGVTASTDFLLDVLDHGYATPAIHTQLAKNYFAEQDWAQVRHHLARSGRKNSPHLNALLAYRAGDHIAEPELLPYLYRDVALTTAQVSKSAQANGFSLQLVSDGDASKINGEPSITASQDGSMIWLVWTDSGASEAANPNFYYWDLKSAQSSDGGQSWSYLDLDTTPNNIDRFHFDPMTTLDATNQFIYAGGMVKGFTSTGGSKADDGIFIYRWNLANNTTSGPHIDYLLSPDKGLITTDNNGHVYVAHHQGIEKSTDFGETFSPLLAQSYVAPHPRINSQNCLVVTDMERTSQCANGGINTQAQAFSSLSFFGEAGDYIPGSFRVYAMVQNALASNDDIYAVYTDLKQSSNTETVVYMTKSTDDGMTWSVPWQISPNITGDQFIPWIEIDSNDGLHVVYFDTRHVVQSDTSDVATLDLYYSHSADGGQTWTESRITPTSFTTPNLIWGNYFFTDYISMSVTDNHVYIAFPWSPSPNQMHMYLATKALNVQDLIFLDGFEQ